MEALLIEGRIIDLKVVEVHSSTRQEEILSNIPSPSVEQNISGEGSLKGQTPGSMSRVGGWDRGMNYLCILHTVDEDRELGVSEDDGHVGPSKITQRERLGDGVK